MDSILLDLLPQELKSKEGIAALSEVTEAPLIGIYFSAHWCPPCRGFTPILSEFYKVANQEKKQIEIVFVSCDEILKVLMNIMILCLGLLFLLKMK